MDQLKAEAGQGSMDEVLPAGKDEPLRFLSPPDKAGQLGRLGAYEVQEQIGQGGNGIVLKALDSALNRIVAIKVMAPHFATSATARKRFLREAQAAAAVTHENVVTIHAVDETRGLPYLVMQYVAGQSLQERIDKSGPLELKEILRIGMQTASGLAAAHAQGLVHRDIKPANILLENSVERVKITDFGLARAADEASLTQSGVVAGTPQYMAPEQARGETVDYRADLFSLGSVLYAMCTGLPPFRATTTMGVLKRVSEEAPRPIKEIRPEIPGWLVAVIERLHAKNPGERYQSATELANVLGQHLAQLQQASWTPQPELTPKVIPDMVESPNPAITSLTICPICGAQLHVPESKVGQTVNCPQCGKAFRVEDASQEIRVISPDKRPVLHGQPAKPKKTRVWVLLVVLTPLLLCCLLPLGFIGFWSVAVPSLKPAAEVGFMAEEASAPVSLPQRIQGTWTVDVIAVDPKQPSDTPSKARITFEKEQSTGAGTFTSSGFDPRFKSGAYRIPSYNWEQCQIELLPDNDNQHYRGIYEFRGNSVWMCLSPSGAFPRDFAAPPGSGNMVLRLEREKK
jgi:serine/threonine protein kinase